MFLLPMRSVLLLLRIWAINYQVFILQALLSTFFLEILCLFSLIWITFYEIMRGFLASSWKPLLLLLIDEVFLVSRFGGFPPPPPSQCEEITECCSWASMAVLTSSSRWESVCWRLLSGQKGSDSKVMLGWANWGTPPTLPLLIEKEVCKLGAWSDGLLLKLMAVLP